jgi:acyl-CoA synthetase (NDP forming)
LAAAGAVAEPGRIVDLTMAGTRNAVMKAALDVMTAAPEFDLVVAVAGSSARFHPELAVQPAIDSADTATPLAVFATPEAPEALVRLAAAGVPAFRTPESCADAIAAALRRQAPQPWIPAAELAVGAETFLDEAAAYARLVAKGIKVSPFSTTIDGALAKGLTFPVAVKALSAQLPHKSDAGGVILGVANEQALQEAIDKVASNVGQSRPDLQLDRVLIQSMASGIGEVLLGFRRDADVGPIVLLAPGGVLAELSEQRSLRLAPVTLAEAEFMIAELPALRALSGYRGATAGDLPALSKAIVALSRLALDPDVIEAEINPLIVRAEGQGVVAVDALMRVVEETGS